jgi:hypothetical protein
MLEDDTTWFQRVCVSSLDVVAKMAGYLRHINHPSEGTTGELKPSCQPC